MSIDVGPARPVDAQRRAVEGSALPPQLKAAALALIDERYALAEDLCRRQLKASPKDVDAARILGEIAVANGALEEGQRLFERCLQIAPGFHLARINYADVLCRLELYEAALEEVARIESCTPGASAGAVIKAAVMVRMGRYEDAQALYAVLNDAYPFDAGLWNSRGHTLKTLGRSGEGVDAYRTAARVDPAAGQAYWNLANMKTYRFSTDEISQMETLVRTGLRSTDEAHVCFALGRAYEDTANVAESMEWYHRGNRLVRKGLTYDAADTSRLVERTINFFSPQRVDNLRGSGCQGTGPIFIVGLPRSGSTLVEQILASHSRVDGTKELPFILGTVRALAAPVPGCERATYPTLLANLDPTSLVRLGKTYLERVRPLRRGAPYFTDKMPNNFLHIGLIKTILPGALIIDVRRNPMGACFSCYKQLFASGQAFSYSLSDLGRYYRDYERLMAHWDLCYPGQILRINYEELVGDLVGGVTRLLDYCRLEIEQNCVEFHRSSRPVATPSAEQVRQPIYRAGLHAWEPFARHLGELRSALHRSM